MSDSVIAQAILEEIRRLATRFERVEGRMSALETSVEDRMTALEGRMSALEGRMSALESGMSTLDGRMSTLEGRVAGVESHMSIVESRISRLEARMTNIEEVVAALNLEIGTWPDMHFLGAAAKLQLEHSREIRNEVADIGVRIKEIFQAMATDPEIKSLRQEVYRFRDRSLTTEVRLGAIEGRLGIKNELEAPVS